MPLRVLIIWELGAGLGHLTAIRGLASALAAQQADVFVAVKDAARATPMFRETGAKVLSSPPPTPAARGRRFDRLRSYTHILHNVGCATAEGLTGTLHRWHALFDSIAPDVVVFEHSPLALLASRGRTFRKVVFGTGFTVPPLTTPLGVFGLDGGSEPDPSLRQDEDELVERINVALKQSGCVPLQHLRDLYQDVDRRFCKAFRELDHFGARSDLAYVGPPPTIPGVAPRWPQSSGPRVFAYLKPFEGMHRLMKALRAQGASVLVSGREIPADVQQEYCASDGFRFERQPVDVLRAARECDVAILNATNATTMDLLLAGRSILQIPLTLEQAMLAKRSESLGVSITLRSHGRNTEELLQRALADAAIKSAARNFAQRYEYHDDIHRRAQMDGLASSLGALSRTAEVRGATVACVPAKLPSIISSKHNPGAYDGTEDGETRVIKAHLPPPEMFSPWSLDEEEVELLRDFVVSRQCKQILEFGPGVSTLAMLSAGAEVTTLECEQHWLTKWQSYFQGDGRVRVIGYTGNYPVTVHEPIQHRYDMVFVDSPSAHKQSSFSRLNVCLFAMQRASVLLLHDAKRQKERRTLDVIREFGWSVRIIESRRGMAIVERPDQ